MIKAAFFDIDGTLISHTLKDIPMSTKKAIQALKDKGIKVFIATGRHLEEMKDLPLSLSFDGYVTLNGQLCLDSNFHKTYGCPITGKDKEILVSLFNEKKIPMLIVEEHRLYLNFVNDQVIQAQQDISSPIPEISDYNGNDIYQFIMYTNESEQIQRMLTHCKISRWNPNAIDIIPTSGGKVKGIQSFLDQYDLKPSDIIAFGDSENDQDMLLFAGIGIAMGNSDQKTKQCANYITQSVDEDGIDHALKHFGIL